MARATGQPAFIPFAFMLLAWVRMLRGELADGAETLDAAIEESRLLGNDQSLAGLILNRSLTALAAGDLELAVSTAREAVDLTRDMDAGLVPAAAPWPCARRSSSPATPASATPSSSWSDDAEAPGCRSCQAAASAPSGSNCSPDARSRSGAGQTPSGPPPAPRTPWSRWEDSGWPRPWPNGRRPRSLSRRVTLSSPRDGRSRRRPPRTRSESRSRRPCHAASPGVRSRRPVNPNAPSPSSRQPPRRCTPAVPGGTGTRRSWS